ncbi:DUF420 domain-containing protein [bacterium]|nr:DUF420 domain-containing protein [bacterium]
MTELVEPPIWPSINASLNGLAALALAVGYFFIKRGNIPLHRATMGFAFLCSSVFLACYLYYHFNYPAYPFQGQGWIRPVYFTILISHIILAVLMLPFIINLLRHALAGRFEKHRQIARWVWPVWMYTSVTGLLIYFMLYHWFNDTGVIS